MKRSKCKIFLSTLLVGCLVLGCAGCRGHKLEYIEGIEATCLHSGVISHWHCMDCGRYFLDKKAQNPVEDVSIPQRSHVFIVQKSQKPTCLASGEEIKICTLCGTEERNALEPTGHFFRVYETEKPSCFTPGERVRVCSACGASETEVIPPIGRHEFGLDNVCINCGVQCIPSENLNYRKIVEEGLGVGYAVSGESVSGDLVIPNYYEGLPILEIEEKAFEGAPLTGFTNYAPLRAIGADAFAECVDLVGVELPETLVKIGDGAFSACVSLEEIELPQTLEQLGRRAFYACSRLKSVSVGKNLTAIGENAFWNCEQLASIAVDEENPVYSGEGNCLVERATGTLVLGTASAEIPSTVCKIASCAFLGRIGLKRIVIPRSVTSIGDFAFRDCVNLSELVFEGTGREWENVAKGNEWNEYTAEDFHIVCLG